MFKNVRKEGIVTVLTELGETVNIDMEMGDLKQKLLTSKVYLEDEQFVKAFLISTVENRKQEGKIREEEIRREECRMEREHELELARTRATQNDEDKLTSTWKYRKSRKVEDYESLKNLIISDKLFQALDSDTASHICLKQGEKWLRPQELAKECDIYFGAKQKSFEEPRNDFRRTFSSEKYVPPHQRREISRRDNGILKRKECFVCGSLLHLARECPYKRKRNEFVPKQNDKNIYNNPSKNRSENQEAVCVCVCVCVVAKVISPHLQSESVQNLVIPLEKINIHIHSKEIEAIIDSGTHIAIVHSSLIPDLEDKE
ncbi:hypothetical protein AVEN_199057-1 [Araneus ventricosus]|uniref:CCHC-type domain-containing protein n=1 Tax=Araneus ventricosus TaxID=182803 RepID=A0A4Y2J9B7_ARAVE|nr:hypothetical protein AVEN_199057-1 [Araneus ventricosus]